MSSVLASRMYQGWVRHERCDAVRHRFQYPMFMSYIDLDELQQLETELVGFSCSRRAPIQLRRQDHAGATDLDWRAMLNAVFDQVDMQMPQGPVRLLTHLRWFGHCFNPISVYYCFACDGHALQAVVLEVTNTPWKERHCYVLDLTNNERKRRFDKCLHVSPLMPMEMDYHAWFTSPSSTLSFALNNYQDERLVHRASVVLREQPLTTGGLWRAGLRHGSMTMKVTARIHWQAARLYFKGAKIHPHPAKLRQGNE